MQEPDIKTQLPSLALFPKVEQDIIEAYLKTPNPDAISLTLAIPKSAILAVLKRKDVREHIESLKEILDNARIDRLKALLEDTIDARLDEVENLADLSRKDTLEVIKVYQDLLLTEKKGRKPEAEQNVYVNILNQVIE